jgi:hypothetical protein
MLYELVPDVIAFASVNSDRVHERTQRVVIRSVVWAEVRFLFREGTLRFLQAFLFVCQLLLESSTAFGVRRKPLGIGRSGGCRRCADRRGKVEAFDLARALRAGSEIGIRDPSVARYVLANGCIGLPEQPGHRDERDAP